MNAWSVIWLRLIPIGLGSVVAHFLTAASDVYGWDAVGLRLAAVYTVVVSIPMLHVLMWDDASRNEDFVSG